MSVMGFSGWLQSLAMNIYIVGYEPIERTNFELKNVSNKLISNLKGHLSLMEDKYCSLEKLKKDYYLKSMNSCKAEESFDRLITDKMTEQSQKTLKNEGKKLMSLKMFCEESRLSYKETIDTLNTTWHQLYASAPQFIKTIEKLEHAKNNAFHSSNRLLNSHLLSQTTRDKIEIKDLMKKLSQIHSELERTPKLSLHQTINKCNRTNISFDQSKKPVESFISFEEARKRGNMGNNKGHNNSFIVVEEELEPTEEDLWFIEELVHFMLSGNSDSRSMEESMKKDLGLLKTKHKALSLFFNQLFERGKKNGSFKIAENQFETLKIFIEQILESDLKSFREALSLKNRSDNINFRCSYLFP